MKKLFLFIFCCLSILFVQAQSPSRPKTDNDYNPELGYFQKAHTDLDDPRFMFTDNTGNFVFGVGATFHMTGYFDFAGSIDDYTFKPSLISIPTDDSKHLGFTMSNTEFHIKAKSYLGKHKFIAYMQINNKAKEWGTNDIRLTQAYISWNNFSVGRTYSFFMDLEAGAMTVDMQGANGELSRTHCLIGYTLPFRDKWTFAVAAEEPSFNDVSTDEYGVGVDFQKTPDVAMHLKYKGEIGHVQLGGLLRLMAYYSTKGDGPQPDSKTFYEPGFGVSLSGKICATPWLNFSAQLTGGTGISPYINDLDDLNVFFGLINDLNPEGYRQLRTVPVEAGYVTATVNWTEKLCSAFLYGFTYVNKPKDMSLLSDLKTSQYFATNLFWHISPYLFVGAEYLHGYKTVYAREGNLDHAHANRIDATITYRF